MALLIGSGEPRIDITETGSRCTMRWTIDGSHEIRVGSPPMPSLSRNHQFLEFNKSLNFIDANRHQF